MWNPVWEKIFSSQAWGKYPGEDLIRFVARNFYGVDKRQKIKILEVGCGPGGNLWFIAREGFSFAGIDGSATAIRQAQKRLDLEIPDWRERGSLHVGDIENMPFETDTFDAVMDNECVSYNDFESSKRIYKEMSRVTKVGGKLFSRTFALGCWGCGTGEKIDTNFWLCDDGPLAGKGATRFTSRDDVKELIWGFSVDSVEELSWTQCNGAKRISELIILGTKTTPVLKLEHE